MSFYKTCPDCGANLDPGESCDCKRQKENGLPDTTQNSPKKGKIPSHKHNIAHLNVNVKTLFVPAPENPLLCQNSLRELRVSQNIPVREMVAVVREIYPKYDKHLHSKCERSETYGVLLNPKAMDALRTRYAPAQKTTRHEVHKLTKRISCRLPDDIYEKFLRYSREDGYHTSQDWLAEAVGKYVRDKDFAALYNREKAREAQRRYCEENGIPFFIRYIILCPECNRDILYPVEHPDGSVTGITVEGAGKGHITYCPHCRASFID